MDGTDVGRHVGVALGRVRGKRTDGCPSRSSEGRGDYLDAQRFDLLRALDGGSAPTVVTIAWVIATIGWKLTGLFTVCE